MSRELKAEAARVALEQVRDGMRLGIGTGSTAEEFIRLLGARVTAGLSVVGVATSQRSATLCRELGIPLSTLEETPELDLVIDGADEIGPGLALIKGGGGALLHEKIVAAASRRMIVIADDSKLVPQLGAYPLPIEINRFGMNSTKLAIASAARRLGLEVAIEPRMDGERLFVSDGGHCILDASFGRIRDPEALSCALNAIPGVVEHGIFLGLAHLAVVAGPQGVRSIGQEYGT